MLVILRFSSGLEQLFYALLVFEARARLNGSLGLQHDLRNNRVSTDETTGASAADSSLPSQIARQESSSVRLLVVKLAF